MATLLGRRLGERLIFTERRSWRYRRTLQVLQATCLVAISGAVVWVLQVTDGLEIIEGLVQTLRSVLAHSSHRFIGGPAVPADPA
ncbi:MAG: hypothetical protein RLY67_139 [Pseudomonadota bacterium]